MTLRKKILFLMTILLSLMITSVFFVIYTWKTSLSDQLESHVKAILMQHGSMLSDEILNGRRMLRILAIDKSLSSSGTGVIRSRLHQWTENKTQFESFYFDDLTGEVYPPSGPSFSVRDRSYFPEILAGNEVTGAPIISRHTGRPVLLLTTPVKRPDGHLKGALAGTLIIPNIISRTTNSVSMDTGGKIYLYDAQGRLLGSTDSGTNNDLTEATKEKSTMAYHLWNSILKKSNSADDDVQKTEITLDEDKILVHFISIPDVNWYLVHAQSVNQLLIPVNKAFSASIVIIGMLILLFAGVFLFFERIIIYPIIKLRDAHLKLESGDFSVRVSGDGKNEFADLARAFNRSVVSLELSEQKFRTIFELFPYPIVLNRLSDGVYIDLNSAAEKYLQLNRSQIINLSSEDFSAGYDIDARNRLIKDKQLDNEPFKITQPDGSNLWIIYSTRLISIAGEDIAMSVMTDVTGLKRAEEALRTGEENYRLLFQHNPAPMLIYESGTLQMLAVNDAFENHYGYTSSEIQKMSLTDLYPDDEKELITVLATDLVRKGHAYAGEWHHCKRDGTIINIEARSHNINYDGHTGRIAVISDITERKQAENKILELNATLEQKVVERTSQLEMAIEELDTTNQSLLESNENLTQALTELKNAQEKLVLSSKMAALGQLIASIAHEINTPLGAILSANTMVNDSININLKETVNFCRDADDDSLRLFENLTKIALNSDPLKYSSSENRKRKRNLLSVADERQIEEIDHSIDTLLDIGFQGDADELIEIIKKKNFQQVIDYTYTLSSILNSSSIIKTAAEKISRVVFALKIYAYHDNESKKVLTDIAKEIDLVLELYYNKYKYGVEIVQKYHHAPEIYVYPEKLNQVWVNLINNALQSMQYRGKLEIEIFEEPDKITVSFTDDGPGVPPDIHDKIFTPFFTTKMSGEGTGLGLDICRKILEEIEGGIGFSSEPGQTVFKVTLKK